MKSICWILNVHFWGLKVLYSVSLTDSMLGLVSFGILNIFSKIGWGCIFSEADNLISANKSDLNELPCSPWFQNLPQKCDDSSISSRYCLSPREVGKRASSKWFQLTVDDLEGSSFSVRTWKWTRAIWIRKVSSICTFNGAKIFFELTSTVAKFFHVGLISDHSDDIRNLRRRHDRSENQIVRFRTVW